MQRSWFKRVGYYVLRVITRITFVFFFRLRCSGRENWPATGGGLVCSNHQSYLDPMLVGLACDRRMNYLARQSLFRFFLFRWLIEFLDAIPIDRDGSGLGGLKETLKRLKRGELVLIFPEGTRSDDGELTPLKPGFISVARRSAVPLVPVGVDGTFVAWPKRALWPSRATIAICIGEPLSAEAVAKLQDDELVTELERRMRACHRQARETCRRVV